MLEIQTISLLIVVIMVTANLLTIINTYQEYKQRRNARKVTKDFMDSIDKLSDRCHSNIYSGEIIFKKDEPKNKSNKKTTKKAKTIK